MSSKEEYNRLHEIASSIVMILLYITAGFTILWGIKTVSDGFYGAVDYVIETLKQQEKYRNE